MNAPAAAIDGSGWWRCCRPNIQPRLCRVFGLPGRGDVAVSGLADAEHLSGVWAADPQGVEAEGVAAGAKEIFLDSSSQWAPSQLCGGWPPGTGMS